MRRASTSTILILSLCAAPAFAQSAGGGTAAVAEPPDMLALDRATRGVQRGPSLKQRIGRMFTGAVVGGWVGYFVSHVAISDWESRSGITSYRSTWAAGGLALGTVAGHLMSGGGSAPPDMRLGVESSRDFISREEIIAAGATNSFELVRSLRKEWLIPRGTNSFRESARGIMAEGEETIIIRGDAHILVYLDNTVFGGTETLADISPEYISRIEFISPAEATYRWGTGHAHGAIQLTTMGAELVHERDR